MHAYAITTWQPSRPYFVLWHTPPLFCFMERKSADYTTANNVLANTVTLVEKISERDVLMIQTPILFTEDYSELDEPVGILKTIVDTKAFRAGSPGSEIIPEMKAFGDRIHTVEGKRGLNAFSNTALDALFSKHHIKNVVLAGAVTSICIDSTGRAAHERGHRVTVLSDCTASRTNFEQNFYCENVFPLYGQVQTSSDFVAALDNGG